VWLNVLYAIGSGGTGWAELMKTAGVIPVQHPQESLYTYRLP
jgi:hypothetical protein